MLEQDNQEYYDWILDNYIKLNKNELKYYILEV